MGTRILISQCPCRNRTNWWKALYVVSSTEKAEFTMFFFVAVGPWNQPRLSQFDSEEQNLPLRFGPLLAVSWGSLPWQRAGAVKRKALGAAGQPERCLAWPAGAMASEGSSLINGRLIHGPPVRPPWGRLLPQGGTQPHLLGWARPLVSGHSCRCRGVLELLKHNIRAERDPGDELFVSVPYGWIQSRWVMNAYTVPNAIWISSLIG